MNISENMSNNIANRLKYARIKAGFKSARAFAHQNRIPYVTYSQHEAGKRGLSPEIIIKYSCHLRVNSAWLLTGQDDTQDTYASKSDKENENYQTVSPPEINANLLGDIFAEVNNLLTSLNINMPDKNKIQLSVELYQALLSKQNGIYSKFDILKHVVDAVKKINLYSVA